VDAVLWRLCQYAAYGAVGGFVGVLAKSGRLELPHLVRRSEDGERAVMIDLGFLGSLILGAVLAAVMDGRPQTAIAYGLAAGFVGPAALNCVLDPLLIRVGLGLVEAKEKDHVAVEADSGVREAGRARHHRGRGAKHQR
jgi:hypothetical protein